MNQIVPHLWFEKKRQKKFDIAALKHTYEGG